MPHVRRAQILVLALQIASLTYAQPNGVPDTHQIADAPNRVTVWIRETLGLSPKTTALTVPPLLVDLMYSDAPQASSGGGSELQMRSLTALRSFYERENIKYAQADIDSIVRAQQDLRLKNDALTKRDALIQFASDKLIDWSAGMLDKSEDPKVALLAGASKELGHNVLAWYFNRESVKRDDVLLRNLQSNLAEIPASASANTATIQNYYYEHGDKVLGSDIIAKLKESGATAAELQIIERDAVTRLITLIGSKGSKGERHSGAAPPDQASEVAIFLKAEQKLRSSVRDLAKRQEEFINTIRAIEINADPLDTTRSELTAIHEIVIAQMPASAQLRMLRMSDNLPPKQKAQIVKSLEARMAVEETIPRVLGGIRDISVIAKSLGAPADAQRFLIESQRIGNTALTIWADYLKENYLGAIANTISLFSASEASDTDSLRFEALMGELREIRKAQATIYTLLLDVSQRMDSVIERLDVLSENVDQVKRVGCPGHFFTNRRLRLV